MVRSLPSTKSGRAAWIVVSLLLYVAAVVEWRDAAGGTVAALAVVPVVVAGWLLQPRGGLAIFALVALASVVLIDAHFGFASSDLASALIGYISLLLVWGATAATARLNRRYRGLLHDQKRAQAVLAEREALLRDLTDHLHDVMWVGRADATDPMYLSPSFERLWGCPVDEVRANPSRFFERIHPEDRERVRSNFLSERHRGWDITYRLVRDDGARWVRDRAFPIPGHGGQPARVAGIAQDITELKGLTDDLRNSRDQLRAILEAVADGIVVRDTDGQAIYANRAAASFAGLDSANDIMRMSLAEWLDRFKIDDGTNDPSVLHATEAALASGEPREEVLRFQENFGARRVRQALVKTGVVRDDHQTRFVVTVIRDVTADRDTEEELRRARAEAERASRVKSRFLASMSHELRTPLNAILGFAQVLESEGYGSLNTKQRQFANHIVRAGDHMLSLVNDLLDLRRLEENRRPLEPVRLSVRSVVDEALLLVQPQMQQGGHRIRVEGLGEDLPVHADRRALVQVLVNLLSNAGKYTLEPGTIVLRVRQEDAHMTLEVSDSGVGIAPDDSARLFTAFEQVGDHHEVHMRGSGLGLALCRLLVEKMGGTIEVTSAEGRGSTFFFTVPASVGATPAAIGAAAFGGI